MKASRTALVLAAAAAFGLAAPAAGQSLSTSLTVDPGTYLDQADLAAAKVIMREPFIRKDGEGNRKCSTPVEEPAAADKTPIETARTSYKAEGRSDKRAGLHIIRSRSGRP